ncbi:hypothetical protein EJ08DRAFT_668686 [Tothia fuscella]|uniref:Microbial-type PARG catalytic domain-containing protein n=1 Tax=Tothia fuscella TaxID=1048955 RepID=A0A9P4U286_9PEZI|nr:hypothetical protein EJ08DRAFT_668686 [Tothia fuscella]
MPQSKTKASDIAIEAKRLYFPQIAHVMPHCYARSILHEDSTFIPVPDRTRTHGRLRISVQDCDPVDLAIRWNDENRKLDPNRQIPVVNMANERRAGGDWESALVAPEECFARRSNLVSALPAPWNPATSSTHYPIPQKGGLYSPSVVIFRSGQDDYRPWPQQEYRSIPVISVAPVRRPKLDSTSTTYSFDDEKELMRDKMRSILRIATYYRYRDLCLGAFGVGPVFRNPARETANMWKELLFDSEEFNSFENIVFAIDTSASSSQKTGSADLEVYRETFDPHHLFPTKFR